MRSRLLMFFAAAAVVAAGAAVGTQAPASKSPRTPDGKPDLTGTYDLATVTPMERAAGTPLVLTDADAAQREKQAIARMQLGDLPSKGDRAAPPAGGDGSAGAAGNVGGYNTFWLDPGSHFTRVNGEIRASILVDPPDGRVPPVNAEARKRNASRAALANVTSDQTTRENDPGWEGNSAYDDPERRPLGERCLLGFGSTSGPPALPNYFYNNLHQIVQTPDSIMILTEMVHDARVVRMNAEHLPKTIRKWMGDSVGKWEGDTLVVDTTNFTDKTRFRGSSDNLHVVERFSRIDDRTLLYRFTIDDPSTWDRSWTGEYAWPATNDMLYEYACHEGNYALGNILRGARAKEAADAAKKK